MLTWRIPNDVELGQVVSNIFTDQNAEQFLIRVLNSKGEKLQARKLIMLELFRDNQTNGTLDFDQASFDSLKKWIIMCLNQNITVGCFTRDYNMLVSVDCLYVRNIRDTFPMLTKDMGEAFLSFIKYMKAIERQIRYKCANGKCNYMTSFGVFTSPTFRDSGIPREMIRMRTWIARTLRIEVIGSAFIGEVMLEAAKKYKYKELQTFRGPEDMMRVGLDCNFGIIFPIKIMGVVYRYD